VLDFNIVQRVKSGTIQDVCTITVTHSRHTLSTKDSHYGKVHENRESASGAEIPSKLNLAIVGVSPVSSVQSVSTKVHEIGLDKYRESGSLIQKGRTTDTAVTEETFKSMKGS
jgi:hypothetical protein